MAEYIEREALLSKLQAHKNFFVFGYEGYDTPKDIKVRKDEIANCMAEVVNAPAADVVEVVRCEKCQHMDEGWCSMHDTSMHSIDFCSYGGRRNDGTQI